MNPQLSQQFEFQINLAGQMSQQVQNLQGGMGQPIPQQRPQLPNVTGQVEMTPQQPPASKVNNEAQFSGLPSPSSSTVSSDKELRELKARIVEKEERLRKLELVERHHNKWSLEELQSLIDNWKEVGQSAFEDLYARLDTETVTKEALLASFGLDPEDIGLELE